jgi:hypothetical protein
MTNPEMGSQEPEEELPEEIKQSTQQDQEGPKEVANESEYSRQTREIHERHDQRFQKYELLGEEMAQAIGLKDLREAQDDGRDIYEKVENAKRKGKPFDETKLDEKGRLCLALYRKRKDIHIERSSALDELEENQKKSNEQAVAQARKELEDKFNAI